MSDKIVSREKSAIVHIKKFVERAKDLIKEISVDSLLEEGGINPYLVAALGVHTIEGVVELFVYRRVERSLGTSFGKLFENFLREVLGGVEGKKLDPKCRDRSQKEKPWICWWDIVLPDKKIVMAVKSGPADMDADQVRFFAQQARIAEQQGYRPYLLFTYGKQAFNVIENTLKRVGLDMTKYLRVGRQIFAEFLGNSDYYNHIIELLKSASVGIDIFSLMERKIKELTEDLKKKYGDDIDSLLRDLS